ncbi:MAG: DUF1573 domain-containing protein, partial [Bacteroidales bacterium]|nr:DUF1573 domain-containing protein [Bacteroidales bacterium]
MNKILIILASLLLLGFPCFADNVLSLSEASGHPSDTVEISLSLENTDDVVAIQLDIPLGTSLTYVTGSCVHVGRTNGHELTASVVNGTLKIITYSLSLSPYTGNSGEVLKFKLKLGNQPGTIVLEPSLAVVSAANGNSLETIVNNGSVTLLTPEIQINTPTIDFGHIPIRSVYNRSISITNSGNEPLSISEITFSNDRFSSDFNGTTIPAGGNGSITLNYAPVDEGAVNEYVTIVSNSISGNQTISLVADPFAVNELHVVQASGYSDSTIMVALTMNNMSEISGMQCKFKMPSALEYVEGSFALNPNRSNGHQVWSGMSNDTLTFVAFSLSNAIFSGNEDTIATFRVKLVGTTGWYYMQPIEPILSNVSGINKLSNSYAEYVIIRSPQIWCDNTLDMGSSSVTETVVRQFYVNNYGDAPLRIDNVVFNQLGFSVQNDLPLVIEQYQSTILNVAYNREQEGNFSANMQIQSNDPTNGVYNVTVSGTRYAPNCLTMSATANASYEDVTLAFDMDNYTDITAVQFDFSYPHRYYTVSTSDIVASSRINGHSLTAFQLNDSVYRVMLFSMSNNIMSGHSGNVVSVTLHPKPETVAGTYSASASGIVLSDVGGVNKFSCDAPSVSFTTVCPVVGSSSEQTVCEGEIVDFFGHQLTESRIYTDTLQNIYGCDSIVTLILTVNPTTYGIDEQVACDSYEWIDGITYTESTNTPTFTLRNAEGCDSVVTLHLTINHSNTGIDEQVACDNYEWIDGVTYTESTSTPTFTLRNAEGCDSVVTLHLTINHSNTGIDEQIACDSFEWIDGVTYTESTSIPTFTLRNAEGCDSVVTLHLTINHSNTGIDEQVACDSYEWIDGVTYTESTDSPTYTLTNAEGCDSVVTLHLTINHSNTGIDEQVACDGFEWIDGVTYTESTNEPTFTLRNAEGCDSVVTLHLTINHPLAELVEVTTCDSYEWNAETYTESGNYTQTFTASNGCDSVVTLHLTINHSNTGIDEQVACDSYEWIDGVTYTESTSTPTFTLRNAEGCDSVVTLHLTINHSNTGIDEQVACDSFEWIDGVTYTESTITPTFTLRNAEGCDSVVTLH